MHTALDLLDHELHEGQDVNSLVPSRGSPDPWAREKRWTVTEIGEEKGGRRGELEELGLMEEEGSGRSQPEVDPPGLPPPSLQPVHSMPPAGQRGKGTPPHSPWHRVPADLWHWPLIFMCA